jgi:hypothetical protein
VTLITLDRDGERVPHLKTTFLSLTAASTVSARNVTLAEAIAQWPL